MASTIIEAKDALIDFINTTWLANTTGASLFFPNMNEDRPDTPTMFGRVSIRHREGTRAALGCSRFRRSGVVVIQLFAPLGEATEEVDILGDALLQAFETQAAIDNLWFRDAKYKEIGPDDDSVYFQVQVEVDFTYDRVV